jgi:hypothetical protein
MFETIAAVTADLVNDSLCQTEARNQSLFDGIAFLAMISNDATSAHEHLGDLTRCIVDVNNQNVSIGEHTERLLIELI